MKIVNLAVVGLGRMGRLYVDVVARCVERAKLVAVYTSSKAKCEEIAKPLGAACYNDIGALLRDPRIDGVVVTTPSHTHADVALMAVERGLHVFVEKPIDVDLSKARNLVEKAERMGVHLLVGYMRRFDESYREAKRLVDEGAVGRVVMYVGISRDPEPPPPGWLRDPKLSGGLVLDLMSHDFDLARWFIGSEPVEVYAVGGELHGGGLGDYDEVVTTIRFANGAVAVAMGSRYSPHGYDIRCEVRGTQGSIHVGAMHRHDLAVAKGGGVSYRGFEWFQKRFLNAYTAEIQHFANLILGIDERPLVTGRDALIALAVAKAVRESLTRGTPITVVT